MGFGRLLIGLAIIFLGFEAAYFGAFNRITVNVEERGDDVVIYRETKSDARESLGLIYEFRNEIVEIYSFEPKRYYRKYLSDVHNTFTKKVDTEYGIVIGSSDQLERMDFNLNVDLKKIPRKDYLVAEFPYRGRFSMWIGTQRVYPAFDKFCEENNCNKNAPVIELYDFEKGKIIYLKEI